jgi:hypothetical protein
MGSVRKALGLLVLGVVLTLAAAPVFAQDYSAPASPANNGANQIDGPRHVGGTENNQ